MKKLIAIMAACMLLLTSCVEGYLVETRFGTEWRFGTPRPATYTVISVAPPAPVYRGYTPIRTGRGTIYYKSVPSTPPPPRVQPPRGRR